MRKVSHRIHFEYEREDSWPVSLLWPEWKPNTDKIYRPEVLAFHFEFDEEVVPDPRVITIRGNRILRTGRGSLVQCRYYHNDMLPEVFRAYVKNARFDVVDHARYFFAYNEGNEVKFP